MGLLDSVLEAIGSLPIGADRRVRGGAMRAVAAVLAPCGEHRGSLAGLDEQFNRGGLEGVIDSWVGLGRNLPISAAQLMHVLGGERLGLVAQQLGVPLDEAASQLACWLPWMVDRLTPEGRLPAPGSAGTGDLGDMEGLLACLTLTPSRSAGSAR